MTPEEAIAKLRTLPEDKQRAVLSQLSPDERKGILGKLTAPPPPTGELRSLTQRERFTNPELYPVGVKGEGFGENVHNIAQRAGVGVFQAADALANPRRTVAGMLSSVLPDPAVKAVNKAVDWENRIPGMKYLTTKLPENATNPIESGYKAVEPGGITAVGNVAPTVGQLIAGGAFGEIVPEVTRVARNAPANVKEGTRTGIQSLIGAGKKAVSGEVEKTAKSAGEAAKKAEEHNRAEISKHEASLKKAGQENVNAHIQHLSEKAKADQINAASKAIPEARSGLESLVKDKVEQADILTEKARHEALAEGNRKYNAVNPVLNHIQADPEFMQGALADALEKLRGSKSEPTLLKKITSKLEHGDAFTYEDLQGDYSLLGREISKGTIHGDEFKAYDTLHEAIGKEMQRIADGEGMGAQLKEAREYWRRMKQTFGKPFNKVAGRAGEAVKEGSPEYIEAQEREYQHRLLGSFNPEIPKLLQEANSARDQLSKLPTEATRPSAEIPKYPEEKTVEPPKTKPIEVPEISTPKLRSDLINRWVRGETGLNKFQVSRLIGSTVFGTLIGTIFGHGLGTEIGSAAGAATYALTPSVIANILSKPGVSEWLTRPPAGELEALQNLPYADRVKITDGLKKVADQAKKQGVKIDPSIVAAIGAAPKKRVAAALTP